MKKTMKLNYYIACTVVFTLFGTACGTLVKSSEKVVDPKKCVILLPPKPSPADRLAARELAKHLKLITRVSVPTVSQKKQSAFVFNIGTVPEHDKDVHFAGNEARYFCDDSGVWLYGDSKRGRKGSLFAVYLFLEKQFNVRWVEPGDDGIVFTPAKKLCIRKGAGCWKPALGFVNIRGGRPKMPRVPEKSSILTQKLPPKHFLKCFESLAVADVNKEALWQEDLFAWRLNRMRLGGLDRPAHGHLLYVKKWNLYSKTHPEIFALNKWGKREPETFEKPKAGYVFTKRDLQFLKPCTTSQLLIKMTVDDWAKRKSKYINACQNDLGFGYCRCKNCLAIDEEVQGGSFKNSGIISVSDRYVKFANDVLRRAQKIRPDVRCCMYAYNETLYPPQKQRLDDAVIVGMVPTRIDSQFCELLDAWKKMGAKAFTIRPNFPGTYLSYIIPMGMEKTFYTTFNQAVKRGVIAADYDSYMSRNLNNTIACYILARAMIHPEKSFSELEDEFYSAYGAAAPEVKEYYTYWRENVFQKRLEKDLTRLSIADACDNFGRAVRQNISKYYFPTDFDKTGKILQKASKKKLSDLERKRLDFMILNHKHARLAFDAMTAPENKKIECARRLQGFRRKNILKLSGVMGAIYTEVSDGDLTGIKLADSFKKFKHVAPTARYWHFKADVKNKGLAEKWQNKAYSELSKWELVPTDCSWESIPDSAPTSKKLRKFLRNYNGIAYYATKFKIPENILKSKKIKLYFGAVDESCWIYLNGKEVGKHIFKNRNDWKAAFEIDITNFIDKSKSEQNLVVRVEDKFGNGGIWQRVYLTSESVK